MKAYELILAESAKDDLERLHAFASDIDPDMAERALKSIKSALQVLTRHPHTCRKVQSSDLSSASLRELVIDLGGTGYLALFEVVDDAVALVLAVRHQRESDYH
ncbi:MAG: type II toxin-antitoxin system RelE/ParE family toxin [Polaromonas sp.]|nr:type II toxin-antitoxin system RelE/ParE family toxin [Polaromonas sp.]